MSFSGCEVGWLFGLVAPVEPPGSGPIETCGASSGLATTRAHGGAAATNPVADLPLWDGDGTRRLDLSQTPACGRHGFGLGKWEGKISRAAGRGCCEADFYPEP